MITVLLAHDSNTEDQVVCLVSSNCGAVLTECYTRHEYRHLSDVKFITSDSGQLLIKLESMVQGYLSSTECWRSKPTRTLLLMGFLTPQRSRLFGVQP